MKHFSLLFFAIIFFSCGQETKTPATGDSGAAQKEEAPAPGEFKLYVNDKGTVSVNGAAVSLEELDVKFKALKEKNGMVFYSKALGSAATDEKSMEIMALLVKHKLPIRFYADSTFTRSAELR